MATVAEVLAAARDRLAAAGVASPDADALALLMHATGRSRADLLLSRNDALELDDAPVDFPALLARRAAREPLQHLLGTAPMMGLELMVGPGVFVPRPETEQLVDWAVGRLQGAPLVADLCTGSGAIALAVADLVPAARVVAVEKSADALAWARRNLAACRRRWAATPWRDREVHLIQADVTDPGLGDRLVAQFGLFDAVLSNPPYVPEATAVDPEVLADPHDAVFGGGTGLSVIGPMMATVRVALRPGGVAAIEHDDDGADGVAAAFGPGFTGVACLPDLAGRDRFTVATRT